MSRCIRTQWDTRPHARARANFYVARLGEELAIRSPSQSEWGTSMPPARPIWCRRRHGRQPYYIEASGGITTRKGAGQRCQPASVRWRTHSANAPEIDVLPSFAQKGISARSWRSLSCDMSVSFRSRSRTRRTATISTSWSGTGVRQTGSVAAIPQTEKPIGDTEIAAIAYVKESGSLYLGRTLASHVPAAVA
jgi:hypothetical protein